jgi:methionyl-tRNA formyltransferase
MRVVFAGTPEPALPSLRALLDSPHEVVAVLTRPDAPAGRGRRVTRSPVGALADEHGLRVLTPASARDPELLTELRGLAPDVGAVVAYGGLLPRAVLDVPAHGWINLHFSLLPAWRGAAPVQHAILAGDEVTGATTFLLEEGLDSGPVLGVLTEATRPTDTAGDLLERLSVAGAPLLVASLDGLESGAIRPQPQPVDSVSLAPKITAEDAHVDWSAPALRVTRLLRACAPAPGAWTTFRGERLGIGPAVTDPDAADALGPGELRVERHHVLVGTGSSAVRLAAVRPAGKREMPAADWARGARPAPGERLGE